MVRVLVASASPLLRTELNRVVSAQEDLVVGASASTTDRAVQAVAEEHPDVVLLDVALEEEGPSEAVRRILAVRAIPIVLVSGGGAAPETLLAALASGAVDVLELPPSFSHADTSRVGDELGAKVRVLRDVEVAGLWRRHQGGDSPDGPVSKPLEAVSVGVPTGVGGADIVVIGASTGGPPALETLLGGLPPSFSVPILVCQHLPKGFASAMAERLDALSALDVRLATDHDRLRSGLALVVPSAATVGLERRTRGVHLRLEERAAWEPFSPSIDSVMRAAAAVYGSGVLAVLLTGMSGDGTDGMLAVRRAGGHTICEAESSSRLHGMCRDAIRAGAVAEEADLSRLATLIMLRVGARS
jgi:two-component system chemotaxis response regulator CheB